MKVTTNERERIFRAVARLARKGRTATPQEVALEAALPLEKVRAVLARAP